MPKQTRLILKIDLTNRAFEFQELPEDISFFFVGGRGLGAYYAIKEIPPHLDPLSPENLLVFLPGILAGTPAPGFSKWMVVAKSPLTGTYARSVCGGRLGAAMRFIGLDGVVIRGKATTPLYVVLKNREVLFLEAEDLWGLDTFETQERLKKRHGSKISVATIGPAGEKGVLFSAIIHERRAAARLGVGAVMGAKNLKALVIDPKEGTPPPIHNKEAFSKLVHEHSKAIKDHPRRIRLQQLGTTFMTMQMHELGIFPVKNFQKGCLSGVDKIGADAFNKLKVKDYGCYGCTTRCGNVFRAQGSPYGGTESEGPEYETIFSFGGEIYNNNPNLIIFADYLCDKLGLDTISTGVTIGFVMELYEKGIVTKTELDGLEARWGDPEFVVKMIYKIAFREGVGELFSKGTKKASELIGRGSEYYAMQVKGLELPGYEPRAAKAHGLGYAVSNIGASHMYGYVRQEISGLKEPREVDRLANEGKGDIVAWNQIKKAIEEVGILCNFADTNIDQRLIADLYLEATGIPEYSDQNFLWDVGHRIVCTERLFNIREGFSKDEDILPKRFLTEPLKNAGPSSGSYYKSFQKLLQEYYQAMGFDEEGRPKSDLLTRLSLGSILGSEINRLLHISG